MKFSILMRKSWISYRLKVKLFFHYNSSRSNRHVHMNVFWTFIWTWRSTTVLKTHFSFFLLINIGTFSMYVLLVMKSSIIDFIKLSLISCKFHVIIPNSNRHAVNVSSTAKDRTAMFNIVWRWDYSWNILYVEYRLSYPWNIRWVPSFIWKRYNDPKIGQ